MVAHENLMDGTSHDVVLVAITQPSRFGEGSRRSGCIIILFLSEEWGVASPDWLGYAANDRESVALDSMDFMVATTPRTVESDEPMSPHR